jgi:hypothetical protein
MYRVQGTCNNNAGGTIFTTNTSNSSGLRIINVEFYGCLGGGGRQQSSFYPGSSACGSGAGGFTNHIYQNNIVRDMGGEGMELNPRSTSSGMTITGNAFHNTGKQTCGTSWGCRPAITIDGPSCGGSSSSVVVSNNLMWDTGSGCVWDKSGGNPAPQILNNTCFDYGKGSGAGGNQPEGINCGNSCGNKATIKNNIIYSPAGTNPLSSGENNSANSNNLCGSGQSCGTLSRVWSSSTVLSTDPTTSSFLKIGSNSEAKATGIVILGMTVGYAGIPISQSTSDIGAFVFSVGLSSILPPTNVTAR